MGSLINFNTTCKNLQQLKDKHKSTVFIETGCFRGNSLGFMLNYDFNKFYSCDIDPEMVNYCLSRFEGKPLEIHLKNSVDFLRDLIPTLNDEDSIMFYLDAHLPEHDKTSGQVLTENDLNFPLEEELDIIFALRKDKDDVIIIDDLRIYEDGPFTGGNWNERRRFDLSLDFLSKYDYIGEKFYSEEGFLVLFK